MIKNEKMYENPLMGISMFSGDRVQIIGEQIFVNEDNTELEQYLYNIVGFEPENGQPFVSLKCNIIVTEN